MGKKSDPFSIYHLTVTVSDIIAGSEEVSIDDTWKYIVRSMLIETRFQGPKEASVNKSCLRKELSDNSMKFKL